MEVKSSIADFKVDNKWPQYNDFCDLLYFATLADVPADIFPIEAGLIIADQYGAEIMREAALDKMVAARRKALMLRFGRACAQRLSRLCHHAGVDAETLVEPGEG